MEKVGEVEWDMGGIWGEDAHERIDPVLRHPSFLFIFRNRN